MSGEVTHCIVVGTGAVGFSRACFLHGRGGLPRCRSVRCALGHGGYGLARGSTTGRIISDLIFGKGPGLEPSPFAITGF